MKQYETVIVSPPNLGEADLEAVVNGIQTELAERFGAELCETRVGESVGLAESPAQGRDIFSHAPQSRGARDYEQLLEDFFLRRGVPTSFRTIVSIFGKSSDACNTVSEVVAAGYLPSAMEMLDGLMVTVIEEAFHDLRRHAFAWSVSRLTGRLSNECDSTARGAGGSKACFELPQEA